MGLVMFLLIWFGGGVVGSLILKCVIKFADLGWTNGDRLICYLSIPLGLLTLGFSLVASMSCFEEICDAIFDCKWCRKFWDWLNTEISEE